MPLLLKAVKPLAALRKNYFPESPKPSQTTAEFTEYRIRVNGNTAFAIGVQVDTGPGGKKSRSHKVDYLEKINGEWKMVGDLFGNEPAPIAETKK